MVARSLHGRKADPRCTCPWRLFRSRCEIGSQRRAQRAKRTGFLMADAPHNVADQARLAGTPNWRCCGRQMRPACATLPSMPGPCPISQVLLKKTIFPAGSGTSNLECPSGTGHMSRFCPMGHQFVQFMVQTRFQVPGSIRFGPTLRLRRGKTKFYMWTFLAPSLQPGLLTMGGGPSVMSGNSWRCESA